MKKKIAIFSLGIVLAVAGCEDKSFDADLLIGKWSRTSPYATAEKSGSEFYRYDKDGTGATWDTAEDVSEEEAQSFSWRLEKDLLTVEHDMEIGGAKVAKQYTLSVLNASTLTYKDDFDKSYTFKKQ